ncbi:NAD(P)/FAD-dependent oxidoreductase [Methanospirillum hungatei]|uniref:NAD(P)/FAD-dependent oxidoreductase n=1 Tax=Methanospirillum hungatei TaxID=2203 RepID=UPI0026EE9CC2|nr:NAD(P)/FAD-dependent oxidoreductase [Methanospirillum hungatei]MCA1915202.1 NAD(P)/FAD-dependent oxidoreductase [Methanospirillum hungatei]
MKEYAVIVIGGGPAGLFCSLLLGKGGCKTLLLEKMPSCGRKLLLSGSGQCNLTHTGPISEFISHYGDHGRFIRPALMHFSNDTLISFFQDRGVPFRDDGNGKYFPESGKARDILSVLLKEANEAGVSIHTGEPVCTLSHDTSGFTVITRGDTYHSAGVVLATGGYTYPATGSTGDGYTLAQALGHTIAEPGPALTPIHIPNFPFRDLSGMSFSEVPLTLYREKKKVHEARGDLLITHTGFSGPGILDMSRYIRTGDELRVSFIQYTNINSAREDLISRFSSGGVKQVKTILASLPLPERFVRFSMELAEVPPDMTCAQFPKEMRNRLIPLLLEYPVKEMKLGGENEAMVSRGGVSLDEVKKESMESRIVPGLYCIGEVLDIDGDCGGYNLQAAFSTGALAAENIVKKMKIGE